MYHFIGWVVDVRKTVELQSSFEFPHNQILFANIYRSWKYCNAIETNVASFCVFSECQIVNLVEFPFHVETHSNTLQNRSHM